MHLELKGRYQIDLECILLLAQVNQKVVIDSTFITFRLHLKLFMFTTYIHVRMNAKQ